MTQLTKLQARTLVQQLIDDPAAKLWSAANLDILIEGALDELWGELLDSFGWLRNIQSTALTPTAPGYIDTAIALTRMYRVQQVGRGGTLYTEADPRDVVVINGEQLSAPMNTYVLKGVRLYLFPLATTADIYVEYSSLATAFAGMLDATLVTWPDGYHLVYAYDAAARAMEKGDREKSDVFKQRADTSMFRLKAFLRKRTIGPTTPWMQDDARDWGGI